MIPRRIQGATHALGAPKGWDADKQGNCCTLHTRPEIDQHGNIVFASAWEPTPEELKALNAGASIVLRVVGAQPPVALCVEPVTG